ncbi:MAG TPA: potassium transporter Trk [Clostridiales bacterium]|nr:MAG: potassium transporter Trk [Clostridiales bacterium GWD2_32_19]HCC07465.1 potassium transporter Trk [Clostridiales bacterium]
MAKNSKQFVVLGLGKFGTSVARTLVSGGHEVLAIDKNEEIVRYFSENATYAVQADITNKEALKELGVNNFDVGIVAVGDNIESSILATVLLKELGVEYVVAKAHNEIHKKILEKIGADKVVFPEQEMGVRIATNLINKNIIDIMAFSEDYKIVEVSVKKEWVGKDMKVLDLRKKHDMNVIAIKNSLDKMTISPSAEYIMREDDILVAIVNNHIGEEVF